jgi:hypothetical protein
MKKVNKRSYYTVIDLINHRNTVLCRSISSVADHIGVDRRTIDLTKQDVYKAHLVLYLSV